MTRKIPSAPAPEAAKFAPESRLVRQANKLSAFYGHPVYLVGSALREASPRDWDMVCIIPDQEFINRFAFDREAMFDPTKIGAEMEAWDRARNEGYNVPDAFWRWADECKKKTLDSMRFVRRNVDFKVYPESYQLAYHAGSQRLRLDTRPAPKQYRY